MDSEAKSIHHGTTYVNAPPQGNPPPYSGSAQQYQPHPGYPAPQPQMHYAPPLTAQPAMLMTTGPTVIIAQQMGPRPTNITCKSCHADVVTRVESNATTRTHLFALILCLVGCWPCVCVPYCMDDCMNASHYCPNCNSYLGSYMN